MLKTEEAAAVAPGHSHHWVIDGPNGPTSVGRCGCGQERTFSNSLSFTAWETRGPGGAEQDGQEPGWEGSRVVATAETGRPPAATWRRCKRCDRLHSQRDSYAAKGRGAYCSAACRDADRRDEPTRRNGATAPHRDTAVSLYPLSFPEAVKALAQAPKPSPPVKPEPQADDPRELADGVKLYAAPSVGTENPPAEEEADHRFDDLFEPEEYLDHLVGLLKQAEEALAYHEREASGLAPLVKGLRETIARMHHAGVGGDR